MQIYSTVVTNSHQFVKHESRKCYVANWRNISISYIIPYHIISYHIISYHIISYHIISYHIIYHIISYHISYRIISYIISYHVICYVALRYVVLYYIILNFHITLGCSEVQCLIVCYVLENRCSPPSKPHGFTFQKTVISTVMALWAPDVSSLATCWHRACTEGTAICSMQN